MGPITKNDLACKFVPSLHFQISKKVSLNIGNENEFWSFSFSAKTNAMAFLQKKKKPKIFGPHTQLMPLPSFSNDSLSLSLSSLVPKPETTPPISLSLLDKNIFSLLDRIVCSLSLSLSRLSSTMFCFVLFLFLFFFFYSTRLIRFGGGKSKLWLWILWLWVGGGCGCGDGSVGFNLGLGVGLPVAMAVVVVVLMIMPLWVWIWWWWWRWVLSSCGKGLWWWWMWILDLVLVLQLVCYGEF